MNRASKFSGLLQSRQEEHLPEQPQEQVDSPQIPEQPPERPAQPRQRAVQAAPTTKAGHTAKARTVVLTGKSSDPERRQATAYIKKTTDKRVRARLAAEGGTRDFSDLVEELLAKWLSEK